MPICNQIRQAVAATTIVLGASAVLLGQLAIAQETLTPNGIADNRDNAYALTNALIYLADGDLVEGSLLIREGRIVEVNDDNEVPEGFFEIDSRGHYIYPGLIDIYTDLGIPELLSLIHI